ncbi:ABC transporter ATP-binding protein [Frankia sp. QA3]|uniref:ABC transporter ATP-binding protein n=1 Tax=Frankia sp. QA3 TaxID=710111 RepID=UPI000269BF7D|nr:ATP-binding cassette domain-containing protein [Frankia sp. QA3]EIV92862.1 ABC-type branched-chain amino acid transport system, ATPase component [Frankia sp. QA3]
MSGVASGLRLEAVRVDRGGFPVVHGVDLVAPAGEVTVLLGPNGAGKTTLMEAVSGVVRVVSGTVNLGGRVLTRASRVARVRAGLSHVEQGRTVFADLTVEENLEIAGAGGYDRARALFPELASRRNVRAGLLSGGEQQMLVLARAIAREPAMILVDELSLGLAPVIVKRLIPVVRALADEGVGVLLVEQFAADALSIGDSAYLLNRGTIVHHGPAEVLAEQPELLRRAYFGGGDEPADDAVPAYAATSADAAVTADAAEAATHPDPKRG